MDFELIKKEAVEVLKNIPYKPFLCLPMSAAFYAMLKDNHGIEAKLITGNLLFEEQYIFKQDFSINKIDSEKFKEWSGHAWVEIEDYICDLSFFRSLYSERFTKPCKRRLIDIFGQGKRLLIADARDMRQFGLRYQGIDVLKDDVATGIIKGMDQLFGL